MSDNAAANLLSDLINGRLDIKHMSAEDRAALALRAKGYADEARARADHAAAEAVKHEKHANKLHRLLIFSTALMVFGLVNAVSGAALLLFTGVTAGPVVTVLTGFALIVAGNLVLNRTAKSLDA